MCAQAVEPLPPIYRWLADQDNIAASDALAAALPQVEPGLASTVADTLIQRADDEAPAGLIAQYHRLSPDLKRLCVERVDHWFQELGRAIKHRDESVRANAVSLITDAADPRLAYLLTIALRDAQPRVRAAAAVGLRAVCDRAIAEREQFCTNARNAEWADAASVAGLEAACAAMLRGFGYVVPALEQAIESFQHHLRLEVLEPVLWCFRRVQSRHGSMHAVARARLDWAIADVFGSTLSARTADFAWLALRHNELKGAAVKAFRTSRNADFMAALIGSAWMTADAGVRRSLHAVQDVGWLDDGTDVALDLADVNPDKLVRFIRATGMPLDRQALLFRGMVLGGTPATQRAGLWGLVSIDTPISTQALKAVAEWDDEKLSPIATWELLRRSPEDLHAMLLRRRQADDGSTAPGRLTFDAYWDAYDRLSDAHRAAAGKAMLGTETDALKRLRERLGASAQDHRRAISMIRTLGWTARCADVLAALARDADPTVRSAAVAALASLRTPTARRSTRDALEDPDDRVQANAIESLSREDVVIQTPILTQKLSHRDNRVRANAVRRLLQLKMPEAARVLLDMLNDDNRAHRASALWVVERMNLTMAIARVEAIAQNDPDERVRARARRLLRRIPDPTVSRPPAAVATEVAT